MANYKYLIKVEPNANNNKYYKMIMEDNSSIFIVEYGRVGATNAQKAEYNCSQWDKKYREKLNKGYQDKTDLVAELKPKNLINDGYLEIPNRAIRDIINRLQSMAKIAIAENYTVSSTNVTQLMIDEAQMLLNNLLLEQDLLKFNKILVNLFNTIPRKMKNVSDYLAKDNSDFGDIIKAEQDLLDVMKGQVVQNNVSENLESDDMVKNITILDAMGLVVEEVEQSDIALIKKELGEISDKFYKAWKITNKRTQEQFDKFVKEENIKVKKLLWHGSRNENWWSIINTGLILRPSAVITGKMFGFGIYFAPKARKSLGYTSINGSYWVKGNSSSAFMSLYDVAYGIPYDAYSFESKFSNLDYNKLQQLKSGANSLHAHEGSMLRNDEIIVYKEEQLTIKYLVELR